MLEAAAHAGDRDLASLVTFTERLLHPENFAQEEEEGEHSEEEQISARNMINADDFHGCDQ